VPHRMNNLPEQHIDSLPNSKREEAYQQIAMVCFYRAQGLEEDEVADKASFNSVEDMYFRLRRWGLSGLAPSYSKPARKPQVAAFEGEVQELPPFSNAATHIRDTIRTLESPYLEHMLTLKEILQDRYFVGKGETDEPNISEVRGAQWASSPV
jgi:hypothetical protein